MAAKVLLCFLAMSWHLHFKSLPIMVFINKEDHKDNEYADTKKNPLLIRIVWTALLILKSKNEDNCDNYKDKDKANRAHAFCAERTYWSFNFSQDLLDFLKGGSSFSHMRRIEANFEYVA